MAVKGQKQKGNMTFHCALFNDGSLVINSDWIREKIGDKTFIVHYPERKPPSIVSQRISKDVINKWKYAEAIINCTHDKEIDARVHSAELSADDSDSSQSKRNIDGDDAIIRELEKDAVQSLQNERSSISDNLTSDSEQTEFEQNVCIQPAQSSSLIDEDIENIEDLAGFKIVLRKLNDKLKILENVVDQLKSCNKTSRVLLLFEKISSIEEFNAFIQKIKENADYRQSMILRWEKLQKISHQGENNAKCYAILMDVFDYAFLTSHIKWGQILTKGKKKTDDENNQTIYLCIEDDFIDMIIEILKLGDHDRKDAKKIVATIVKNLIKNKIKRDSKK